MNKIKISKDFIDYFDKFTDNQEINSVLQFILKQRVNINVLNDEKCRRFIGLATLYGIYYDLKNLDEQPNKLKCFIMLHELAHAKRMKKLGKKKIINDLSDKDFDSFCNHIINEEIIADRYASFLYFILTKEKYPVSMTQELHLESNKVKYKKILHSTVFGLNDGTEKTYKKKLKEIFDIDV